MINLIGRIEERYRVGCSIDLIIVIFLVMRLVSGGRSSIISAGSNNLNGMLIILIMFTIEDKERLQITINIVLKFRRGLRPEFKPKRKAEQISLNKWLILKQIKVPLK